MTADVATLASLDAMPHAVVFEADPRTVRLSLDAGDSLPAHQHPGRTVVVHVLEGALDFAVGDEVLALEAGDVARFDGAQNISPTARTDATALLVLAQKPA